MVSDPAESLTMTICTVFLLGKNSAVRATVLAEPILLLSMIRNRARVTSRQRIQMSQPVRSVAVFNRVGQTEPSFPQLINGLWADQSET